MFSALSLCLTFSQLYPLPIVVCTFKEKVWEGQLKGTNLVNHGTYVELNVIIKIMAHAS
jgi:hypothetical protein